MIVSLVVAIAENGVIGRDGGLPWRLSSDLKTFRRLTMGKPLIMGRRTFQSLKKPLDGRDNIVVSRDPHFRAEGAIVEPSFEAALDRARLCARARGTDEIMVIGGTRLFADALATRVSSTKRRCTGRRPATPISPQSIGRSGKRCRARRLHAVRRTTSQPSSWCWSVNKQRRAARLRLKQGGQQPILEARLRSRDALSYKASRSIPAEETGFLWSPARAKGAARPVAQSRPALKQ